MLISLTQDTLIPLIEDLPILLIQYVLILITLDMPILLILDVLIPQIMIAEPDAIH
jgi:hypothetical protein